MTENTPPTLFHERLRGVPLWLGTAIVVIGLAGGGTILLLSRDHFADPLFWLASVPGVAAAVLAPLAIAMWRLDTEVRPGMLVVHLRPFRKRDIPLSDVESCTPRTYKPMREYLGWGWRVGPTGGALTVPGRHGLQLILRGGERLLISSNNPQELAVAIRSAQRHA